MYYRNIIMVLCICLAVSLSSCSVDSRNSIESNTDISTAEQTKVSSSEATHNLEGNKVQKDTFDSVIALYSENELVKDNAFAASLDNIALLKTWIEGYQQGKPGKVAILIDGMGFPSALYILESTGSATYTITKYNQSFDNDPVEPPQVYESSIVVERAYDYIFGADFPVESQSDSLVVHNHAALVVEETEWSPIVDKLFGQINMEQAEEAAKEIEEHIYKYSSIISSFYSGGYYLRESVLNQAGDYSGPEVYYKVMGAIKINSEQFYVVYGNQDKAALDQGEHGGNIVAISEDGNLIFIQSMVDGRWIFVDDKNEKVIAPV